MRVTQKNLVYVIGLSLKLITDEALPLLRGQDYFGQYGKIQKIMINKRKDIPPLRGGTFDKSGSSVSVYVTFARKEDASKCIAALDSAVVDGNTLRAAYGTTKYCTAFLQHRQCQNPNCMYLHSEQDQDDTESHTREEAVTIQHAAKMGQHPSSKTAPPATKPPPTDDRPERPILPTSVSWAKAAVGGRAHSPPQERIQQDQQQRQPIPSIVPSQPSPVSTPEPTRVVSPVTVEASNSDLDSPSETSLSLAPSDPHNAMRIFDKILENFQKGSFKFGIATNLLQSDDFKLASQISPYFQFRKDSETSDMSDVESKDSEPKQTEPIYSPKQRGFNPFASATLENGTTTHKRQQSRFAYVNDPISKALAQPIPSAAPQSQLVRAFSPPRMSDPILMQQLQPSHTSAAVAAAHFKSAATPPPPGMYFSHVQQFDLQRRQQQQQLLQEQQRMQNYNPDYAYYPQQGPVSSSSRNYNSSYDDQDHASVYAPQARRHLLDNQGTPVFQRNLRLDLQDLSGSLMNMRMSPHLPQGFGNGQPPLPQSYGAQQSGFVGRRYMG